VIFDFLKSKIVQRDLEKNVKFPKKPVCFQMKQIRVFGVGTHVKTCDFFVNTNTFGKNRKKGPKKKVRKTRKTGFREKIPSRWKVSEQMVSIVVTKNSEVL